MKQAKSKRFAEEFSIAYLERVVAPVSAIIDRIRMNQQRSLDDPMKFMASSTWILKPLNRPAVGGI
jgi:hypothetical protein